MFTKIKVASAMATILAMNHQAHANSARLVNPANNHAYQCLDSTYENRTQIYC
jgi:hypothetical protein